MNTAKRGELWLVDLGFPNDDHEKAGRRPAVIFQTDDLSPLSTVVLIPAREAGQELDSVALCHQIRALNRRKLTHKIGDLAPERLTEIELAVIFVLGISS